MLSHFLQVRERMEELRSMLGWILVHWGAQKQQWLHKKSRHETSQDDIYSEATMCSPSIEVNKKRVIYCMDNIYCHLLYGVRVKIMPLKIIKLNK